MHEIENISNRERLVWVRMLSSRPMIAVYTSVVVRQLFGQSNNLTAG